MEIAKNETEGSKSSSAVDEISKQDGGTPTTIEVSKSEVTTQGEKLDEGDCVKDNDVTDTTKAPESVENSIQQDDSNEKNKVLENVESDESEEEVETSEEIPIKKPEAAPSIKKCDDKINDIITEESAKSDSEVIKQNEISAEKEVNEPLTTKIVTQIDIDTISEGTESIKLSEDTTSKTPSVPTSESLAKKEIIISDEQQSNQHTQEQVTSQQLANSVTNNESTLNNNQHNMSNTLKEIISDIDRVIEQEDVLQEQKRQQQQQQEEQQAKELQRLIDEKQSLIDQIKLQQQANQPKLAPTAQNVPNYQAPPLLQEQLPTIKTKTLTNEKSESYSFEESSSTLTNRTDVTKIFNPVSEFEDISPKNRKLYASSAFYSSNLHPTVEDQVSLARRISYSLCDISNHQSKGQSMFVNRKKRSVKWVHEGKGQPEFQKYYEESRERECDSRNLLNEKVPLKLFMNPHGKVQDINSVRELISETVSLSPNRCAELVNELNAPKGRGAELFAKRRRKAEKWIVDENNASIEPQDHQQPHKLTSPAILNPPCSDVRIHRVQQQQEPSLKIIKSPWEAAQETGPASYAFEDGYKQNGQNHHYEQGEYHRVSEVPSRTIPLQDQTSQFNHCQPKSPLAFNSQRDLAYKPNIAQGWKAPAVTLPKELYVPKEIPLKSYAPPPVPSFYKTSGVPSAYQPQCGLPNPNENKLCPDFPMIKPGAYNPGTQNSSQSTYSFSKELHQKQQPWNESVYKQQSSTTHSTPVNFNPSPLPFNKLAKFEQQDSSPKQTYQATHQRCFETSSTSNKLENISPIKFSRSSIQTPHKSVYQMGGSSFNQPKRSSYPTPMSPRPTSQQFPTQDYKHYDLRNHGAQSLPHSTIPFMDCQNFNVSARGWGGARQNEPYRPIVVGPKVVGNLGYSDF
ncbi:serine/threonine-protein kinase dst2-like isoform X2 [Eupeodes corollae]|uniref:serine/threonine-protein kinase dst2-like isoform X2 n=1 Tax=Eupeodes corollae TaxID=290404 RepID=UPI002491227F|nr:serine/threonine-protein kinase dst2-like isoform X2 [Eupeodes corollae]